MQKHSIWFLVARHWRAVARNPNTDAFQLLAVLVAAVIPSVSALLWAYFRHRGDFGDDILDLGFVLTAVSILVGFLFGLMTWIFQLRRDYSPSPVLDWTDASIPKLLDETFYAATYGAFLAGVAVVFAVPKLSGAPALNLAQEAVVLGLVVHLALTLLMLLRRLAISYDKLANEKTRAEARVRERTASDRRGSLR